MNDAAFHSLREKIKAGDDAAFGAVFEECGQYCIKVLMKNTSCSYSDAEDILMDAMINFRDKMINGKITYITSLKAYLYTTCWNMWMDHSREQQKWRKAASQIERDFYDLYQEENDPLIRKEIQLENEHSYRQKLNLSLTALHTLGEKCQKILTLFYVNRRRMQEIAETMGFANANVAKTTKMRCYKQWMTEVQKTMQV